MNTLDALVSEVLSELERATIKFPTWPTDPLHALVVLGEEYGELTKAMAQLTYEPEKSSAEEARIEAIQTAAMALRLAMSLDRYNYKPSQQHDQEIFPQPSGLPHLRLPKPITINADGEVVE